MCLGAGALRIWAVFSGCFKAVKLHRCFKYLLHYFSNVFNRKNRLPIESSKFLFESQVMAHLVLEMDLFLRLCCFIVREALKRRAFAVLGDFHAHLQRQFVH